MLLEIENHVVTFSLGGLVWVCGAIITIGGVVTLAIKAWEKAKAPNVLQDTRIDDLERRQEKMEAHLDNDRKRLDGIEEGNRVIQRSLFALMSHAIDGNDVDKLKRSTKDLQDYLINK